MIGSRDTRRIKPLSPRERGWGEGAGTFSGPGLAPIRQGAKAKAQAQARNPAAARCGSSLRPYPHPNPSPGGRGARLAASSELVA
jgi:hypothetical protein